MNGYYCGLQMDVELGLLKDRPALRNTAYVEVVGEVDFFGNVFPIGLWTKDSRLCVFVDSLQWTWFHLML